MQNKPDFNSTAPIQSGDVRNQALSHDVETAIKELAHEALNSTGDMGWVGARLDAIRAIASTPSAAMQGQGVPVFHTYELFGLGGHNTRTNVTVQDGVVLQVHGQYLHIALEAPTPPAAQPQAGGRELTDADIERMWNESYHSAYSEIGVVLGYVEAIKARRPYHFARAIEAHITGTKGATE